jgi:hypothetical protein
MSDYRFTWALLAAPALDEPRVEEVKVTPLLGGYGVLHENGDTEWVPPYRVMLLESDSGHTN